MEGHDVACEVLKDGRLHVRATGIAAPDFDKPITVEGPCGKDGFGMRMSLLTYAASSLLAPQKTDMTPDQKTLNDLKNRAMAATYQYYLCAKEESNG